MAKTKTVDKDGNPIFYQRDTVLSEDDFNAVTLISTQIDDLVELGRKGIEGGEVDSQVQTLFDVIAEYADKQLVILQAAWRRTRKDEHPDNKGRRNHRPT